MKNVLKKIKDFFALPICRKIIKNVGMFVGTILCLCLVCVVLVAVCGIGLYSYIFSDYEPQTSTVKVENIAISDKAPDTKSYHIALLGIDNEDGMIGRSDTIMIFTVDKEHKQLKLTSILRDSYVPIKDHNSDKINHAYAYGGAELTLHTINSNFNMNVSEYVALDFQKFMDIIDMVNGVDLTLSAAECEEINRTTKYLHPSSSVLPAGGNVHLDGFQAITYTRIRYIDSETQRTSRQRYLIQQLAYKLKNQHMTDYPKLLRQFLPMLDTSLSEAELMKIAVDVLSCDTEIKQYTVPAEADNAIGGSYNGYWCWRYDVPAAADRWHEFLETKVE